MKRKSVFLLELHFYATDNETNERVIRGKLHLKFRLGFEISSAWKRGEIWMTVKEINYCQLNLIFAELPVKPS